jgi:hypothetical protein
MLPWMKGMIKNRLYDVKKETLLGVLHMSLYAFVTYVLDTYAPQEAAPPRRIRARSLTQEKSAPNETTTAVIANPPRRMKQSCEF